MEVVVEKVSSLIERCCTVDSEHGADILDNCELFRTKIITLWDEFLQLKLVKAPVSDKKILDDEKIALEFIETNVVTGSDALAIGASNVDYNISTHVNTNSDYIESSDEDENELFSPLKVPPVTGEIKKVVINRDASNVSARSHLKTELKLELGPVEMDNTPVIDQKNLLSLDKLNASGMRIANKEKPNDEITSCSEENKNENILDQLKLVLAAQSAQTQKQTDLLLQRSDTLHEFVLEKANNTDHLIASVSGEIAFISRKSDLALCKLDKTAY